MEYISRRLQLVPNAGAYHSSSADAVQYTASGTVYGSAGSRAKPYPGAGCSECGKP